MEMDVNNLSFSEKLDFILENDEALSVFVKSLLEAGSVDDKKQTVNLLSALVGYPGGRKRILRCLDEWKTQKGSRYRFEPLVNELNSCEDTSLTVAWVSLINCLLSSCESSEDRIRMRNEFSGLKIQATFAKFRADNSHTNSELFKQLDIFDEQKTVDDEQMTGSNNGVDLNSHVDVFYAVLKQVSQTPNEILFLNILQHLLQIDSHDTVSDYIWETAEKLLCRTKLLDSKEEAEKLLRLHSYESPTTSCHCACHDPVEQAKVTRVNDTRPPTPPPLPPPAFLRKVKNSPSKEHKDAPFAELISKAIKINGTKPGRKFAPENEVLQDAEQTMSAKPANQPQADGLPHKPKDQNPQSDVQIVHPLAIGPRPKQKLKTLAWNKVPIAKVVNNRDNIWIKAAGNFSNEFSLDFDVLEELFCQTSPPNTLERKPSSSMVSDRKKRDTNEINLLDPKRSLNVNIFLRQFRGDVKDLTTLIQAGDGSRIGLEKLRSLMKIMPELDEIEALTNYTEDKTKLGGAEKFFMALIEIPLYRLRVESMLLKEEFSTMVDSIKHSLEIVISAAQDLKTNSSLHEVMYLVLMVGNYLNSGSYGGNAVGFKMTSLWKLVEIRANKPNVTLLHYVVMEVEKKNSSLLEFSKQMKYLEEASKLPIETVATDFRMLKEKTTRVSKQLLNDECAELLKQMNDFLEYGKQELIRVDNQMHDAERLRTELALFFCEDPQTFKLEDCFKIFNNFCTSFNKAIEENNERKIIEEKRELRRRQIQEQEDKVKAKETLAAVIRRTNFIDEDDDNDLKCDIIRSPVTVVSIAKDLTFNPPNEENDAGVVLAEECQAAETRIMPFIANKNIRQTPSSSTSRRRFTNVLNNDLISTSDRERPKVSSALTREEQDQKQRRLLEDAAGFRSLSNANGNQSPLTTTASLFDISNEEIINNLVTEEVPLEESLETLSMRTPKKPSSSSSSFTECPPLFAKPFGRIETARISSVSDLRHPTLITPDDFTAEDSRLLFNQNNNVTNNFSNKTFFRLGREKRSQSLHISFLDEKSSSGSRANDLTELLSNLENENKINPFAVAPGGSVRRRVGKINAGNSLNRRFKENFATASDGDDKLMDKFLKGRSSHGSTVSFKHSSSSVEDLSLKIKFDQDMCDNFTSPKSEQSAIVYEEESFELPSASGTTTKLELTKMDLPDSSTSKTTAPCSSSQIGSNFNSFSSPLPTSSNSHVERPGSFKLCAERHIRSSPQSYSDQSDARSTESPTESVGEGERDEGFETESHSTACSEFTSQLSPNAELPATTSSTPQCFVIEQVSNVKLSSFDNNPVIAAAAQKAVRSTAPSFMSGTKASIAKNLPSKQPINVKNAIGAGGSFVKRMIESMSNKKTSKVIEKLPEKLTATNANNKSMRATVNGPSSSNASRSKPGDTKTPKNHPNRHDNSARASHSSSSSLSASPVRKPMYSNDPNGSKPFDRTLQTSTMPKSSAGSSVTTATKQRLTQMRNRLKVSKETTSSSESDKGPPVRRIPPRTLKSMASKGTNNNNYSEGRKLSVPDKTWQRLMSPPKTKNHVSDSENRIRERSVSSASSYVSASNVRSPGNKDKSPSNSTNKSAKVWR